MTSDVAAVILAAGEARRFRAAAGVTAPTTKLIALHEGEPLVRCVAIAALSSRASPVIVVTGHAAPEVREALSGLAVTFAHNEAFATGLSSSLRAGIAALPETTRGALTLLGDMPRVSAALIDRLIHAFESNPQTKAVAPRLEGSRGNPVLIARALFPDIMTLAGDTGARRLLQANDGVLEVDVTDDAVAFDVDTPEALGGERQAAPA